MVTQENTKLQWDLEVDGKSFHSTDLAQYVESVEYTVEKNLMVEMNFTMLNQIVKDNSATERIFARGRVISFYCGWGEKKYIGTAVIEHADISTSGQRITFKCRDKGKDMARKEKDATFPNTTDSQIVEKISKDYMFSTNIEATTAKVSRVQHHRTDYQFINSLAAKNGYCFYVQYVPETKIWELHFEKPKNINQKEAYNYTYSGTDSLVLAFDPTITGDAYRDTKITLYAYLLDEKKASKLEQTATPQKLITLTGAVAGDEAVESLERRFQNEAEAKAFLEKMIKDREEAYMTATAKVVGNNDLRCLEFVYFGGLKFMFFEDISGYWRMERVTHTLAPNSSVFTTSLDLVRVKKGSFYGTNSLSSAL